jgi:hypothetical protein
MTVLRVAVTIWWLSALGSNAWWFYRDPRHGVTKIVVPMVAGSLDWSLFSW